MSLSYQEFILAPAGVLLLPPADRTLLLLLLLSRFSRFCVTPWTATYQAPPPWDSLGKNTGVGCHFLLQCMKVKSENEVTQLCPTLRDPMDCSLPGSSVNGIFQARVLEWGDIAFSRQDLGGMLKTHSRRDPGAGHCQDEQGERERKHYGKKKIGF